MEKCVNYKFSAYYETLQRFLGKVSTVDSAGVSLFLSNITQNAWEYNAFLPFYETAI